MLVDMRDAFFDELLISARAESNLIFLTADHGAFALDQFQRELPDRFINVGIAEQNMIGVAAGLASRGKVVFVYGIAPFVSLRVLEHLTVDVAAMGAAVNVVSVGAGFTYSTDGPTHHGLQDLSAVLTIPNITVLNSSDPLNTRSFVQTAVRARSPHYIRIEKEKLPNLDRAERFEITSPYGYSLLAKGNSKKILIVSTGALTHHVHKMILQLESELGFEYSIIDLHRVKPISLEAVKLICSYENVITIEEGYTTGLGAALLNAIHSSKDSPSYPRIRCLGVDEKYIFDAGCRELLQELYGPIKMIEQLIRSNHKI